MSRVLVLPAGSPVGGDRMAQLGRFDTVIAADGGADHAMRLGLAPDLVIGDLDSITASTLQDTPPDRINSHPRDKDATDLALALEATVSQAAETVVVFGGGGGRLDHLLGNVAVICGHRAAPITWVMEHHVAYPVHGRRLIDAPLGVTVGLLAVGGIATGVSTDGLHWPLAAEDLSPFTSRGVSNLTTDHSFTVEVGSGTVLVVVEA